MISTKKQTYLFYSLLASFVLFACIAYLNVTFQVLLYAIVILSPIFFDDTKTISVYFFTACFMACLGGTGFLVALNVSFVILEIKKILLMIKNKQDLKDIKKIFIVWITLFVVLTLYSLIYNKFKISRMGMVIDFFQCCLVCYLVRKDIDIKHIAFSLFTGIIASVATASVFDLANINNDFVVGTLEDRFGGFFRNVNTLSVYCTLCSSTFIVLLLTNKLKFKYYFYLPLISTCMGLLAYSKAFMVITALVYACWFAVSFIYSKHKKRYIIYSAILLVGMALVAIVAKDYILSIFDRFTNNQYSSLLNKITTGRADIWEQYLKRWLKSPLTFLFGNGYTAPKIPSNQYEHSIYVAFLHQFGVVGSAVIIGILVWTIRKNAKLQKNLAYYIPLAVLMVNGIVSNLSGILCTCLIWLMAFYFVADTNPTQNLTKTIADKQETETGDIESNK